MSRYGHIALLSSLAVFEVFLITWKPHLINDENKLLKSFFDEDFIAFLAVILTISIGLLAQLFVSVAKLGETLGKDAVNDIRRELRSTARWLVGLFFLALALLAVKSIVLDPVLIAVLNALLLMNLVFYLLILSDVILSVFDFDI